MEHYIARYGYIGLFIGTFIEGEATALLGGVFAKFGYLEMCRTMIWVFLGTYLGDLTFFSVGKVFGKGIIERYHFLKHKASFADKIIKKYGNLIIVVVRFLTGIRVMILMLLGCTNVRVMRFVLLNMTICIIWSIGATFIGYLFANVIYCLVGDIKRYEEYIIIITCFVILLLILIIRHILKERERRYAD